MARKQKNPASVDSERQIWGDSDYCTLLCSATSQDSKAEKSKEVAMPPRMRPIMRILYSGECLVMQLRM